jgi:hypothetical protein
MSIVELGMPTGFEADLESIDRNMAPTYAADLKHKESLNRKVVLYFDKVGITYAWV